jgi:phosphatidylserine decarboxylase
LQPITLSLVSTRVGTPSTGSVQIKLGFVPTSNTQNLLEFDEIFTELMKCSQPSLVSAPPVSFRISSSFSISKYPAPCQTEGVGTVRSHKYQAYDDDGGLSSDAGNSDDEGEFADAQEDIPSSVKQSLDVQIPANPPQLVIHPVSISPGTPTPGNLPTPTLSAAEPTPKASGGFSVPSARFIPKMMLGGKKFSGISTTTPASPALASPGIDAQGVPVSSAPAKNKFVRNWSSGSRSASPSSTGSGIESANVSSTKRESNFKFQGANDIVGIVLLEIQNAFDLPRLLNSAFDFFFFRSSSLTDKLFISDSNRLGYGSIRCHLIRQEGIPHTRYQTFT